MGLLFLTNSQTNDENQRGTNYSQSVEGTHDVNITAKLTSYLNFGIPDHIWLPSVPMLTVGVLLTLLVH